MSSTQIIFNKGGNLAVTPASSEPLDITVAGRKTFSVAWNTNVATTIDDFIAAHAQALADEFGIFAEDGSTTLNLWGFGGATITSANATVGSITATSEITLPFEQIAQVKVASATSLTVSGAANVLPSASDVFTLAFVSAADRVKALNALNDIKAASRRGAALVRFPVAAKATVA